MAAVERHGRLLLDAPGRTAGVRSLGVDEATFLHSGPWRRTAYVTGMVDLERGLLLDVVPGRAGRVVIDWLRAQPGYTVDCEEPVWLITVQGGSARGREHPRVRVGVFR
jgi:hypothetical protein